MTERTDDTQKANRPFTRLVRTLSRTRKEGEDYRKDIATIETDLPPGMDVPEAFDRLEATLETHLKIEKILGEAKPSPEPKPILDPGELDKLSWTAYREGHSAGWIFTDKAPRALAELLEKGPLTLGRFTYKFSGPEEKPRLFISRAPVKET